MKLLIGAFFVWVSAQMGSLAEEILARVRESVQASELLTLDGYLAVWTIEQKRTLPPKDQEQFEIACRAMLSARGGRPVTHDRWGQPYVYECLGRRPVHWRITSMGPDRRLAGERDPLPDDLIVERVSDRVEINRDPASIMERAIERKLRQDQEILERLRELSAEQKEEAQDASSFGSEAEEAKRQQELLERSLEDLDRILAR